MRRPVIRLAPYRPGDRVRVVDGTGGGVRTVERCSGVRGGWLVVIAETGEQHVVDDLGRGEVVHPVP